MKMEKDLEKDKERANKIVNDIFDKYESNSYMYQKIKKKRDWFRWLPLTNIIINLIFSQYL